MKAGNGEVISTSDVYTSEKACRNGISSAQENVPVAAVENQAVESYTVEKLLGVDLPDDIVEKVVAGVKAKLSLDDVSGIVDDLKKFLQSKPPAKPNLIKITTPT